MSNFSTVDNVRSEAGFTNNSDVTNPNIQRHLDRATNRIRSVISVRYLLNELSGSNFTGSPAETLLKLIEEQLAAGYLMSQEYGAEDTNPKNGKAKIAEAEKILGELAAGKQILIGVDSAEFPTRSAKASGTAILTGPSLETSPRDFGVKDRY